MRSYKVEIDPTKDQITKINQTIGVCKFVYNLMIITNKERYGNNERFLSGYDFSKWLNNEYFKLHPEHLWIKKVSSKAIKQSIMNADGAFKKFFKKSSGFPNFKKKHEKGTCYFPKNNKSDLSVERHRIKVPTIGFIKLKEYGYIPINSNVKSCTITRQASRYYISVLVDEEYEKKYNTHNEGIGIDLGIKDFVITSKGDVFKNINKSCKVKSLEKKLKRQQRAFARKPKKKGESNRNKNRLMVQKLHARLARVRTEYIRCVVNSLVKQSPQFAVIEDLNVSGMMKNRHLSKAIAKQGFYYFRTFLKQQCDKHSIEVRLVSRWFPSSKMCSCCGKVKKELKLSDRIYTCECGLSLDRDLNASINLKNCLEYKVL